MIPGTPERRSHDYARHGTIDLLAALNTATGTVISKLSVQHRPVISPAGVRAGKVRSCSAMFRMHIQGEASRPLPS